MHQDQEDWIREWDDQTEVMCSTQSRIGIGHQEGQGENTGTPDLMNLC